MHCAGISELIPSTEVFPLKYFNNNNTAFIIKMSISTCYTVYRVTQEAQLMLTNPRDALEVNQGHQTVAFHMLGIVSSCAIVTLSLISNTVFTIFDFKKCHDLEIWVRGHSRSLKVGPFERLCMVSY